MASTRLASLLSCLAFALLLRDVAARTSSIEDSCRRILYPECTCGPEVINCTNARDITAESLAEIPTHFSKLTSLHLSGNKFEYLDKDAFHLSGAQWHLKQLDLSRNAITDIHGQAFSTLPSLQELKLSHNSISFLRRPYAAGHRVWNTGHFLAPIASTLRDLDLSNAFDQRERRESTQFLKNLTTLLFDPDNRFDALQYLQLSNNDLTDLPANAFQPMPSLQYLYLSNNKLSNFRIDAASGKELKELHLQSNLIRSLDDTFMKTVDGKSALEKVYLAKNPFNCDCHSRAFVKWVKQSLKVADKESLYCANALPRQFIARSLISLNEEQLRCSDGKSAVYAAGVFALCSVAAIGLLSLLSCIVYANKRFLFRTGTSIRNWLTMATSGGYEILESGRPSSSVKAEMV